MTRAPWNNESRICRWPDGGFSSGPSRREKLRKKYPELQKKWEEYIRCSDVYDDAIDREFHKPTASPVNKKKWKVALENFKKEKKDYEFLEKMLWDY